MTHYFFSAQVVYNVDYFPIRSQQCGVTEVTVSNLNYINVKKELAFRKSSEFRNPHGQARPGFAKKRQRLNKLYAFSNFYNSIAVFTQGVNNSYQLARTNHCSPAAVTLLLLLILSVLVYTDSS